MRPFRRLGGVLAFLLVALLANLSWLQVIDADSIRAREGNTRQLLGQYNRLRGPILVESTPVALSVRSKSDDVFLREYPDASLFAAVTGFSSLSYGATGIERAENGILSGRDDRLFVDRVQQLFAGRQAAGGAVGLTLSRAVQTAVHNGLADAHGAAVAINARTGAVLALDSTPGFDPALLSPDDPTAVRAAYKALTDDPGQPLRNRALETPYSVPDAIGLVAAAAVLDIPTTRASTAFPSPTTLSIPSGQLKNPKQCTARTTTMAGAMAKGCITAIAAMGKTAGAIRMQRVARAFGFGSVIGSPITAMRSAISQASPEAAASGRSSRVSVLQLALIAAAGANAGTVMRPYLVEDIRSPDLTVLSQARPTELGQPLGAAAFREYVRVMRDITTRTCPECVKSSATVRALSRTTTSGTGVFIGWSGRTAVAVVIEPAAGQDARRQAVQVGLAALETSLRNSR